MALTTKFYKPNSTITNNLVTNTFAPALSSLITVSSSINVITTFSVATSTAFSALSSVIAYTVPSGRTARVMFNFGSLAPNAPAYSRSAFQSISFSVRAGGSGTSSISVALSQQIYESVSLNLLCTCLMNSTSLQIVAPINFATSTDFDVATSLLAQVITATSTSGSRLSTYTASTPIVGIPSLSMPSTEYYLGPGDVISVNISLSGLYYISNVAAIDAFNRSSIGSVIVSFGPLSVTNNLSTLINYFASFIVIEEAAS